MTLRVNFGKVSEVLQINKNCNFYSIKIHHLQIALLSSHMKSFAFNLVTPPTHTCIEVHEDFLLLTFFLRQLDKFVNGKTA